MSLGTKSYFLNETQLIHRSQDLWNDLGYSLDIPWNDVYTAGWQDAKTQTAPFGGPRSGRSVFR